MRWIKQLPENLRLALSAVRSHVLRSLLTMLGVMVGVFSIIVTMTSIRILQNGLETQLSQLGSHSFQIQRWPAIQFDGDPETWRRYAARKVFYLEDARHLQQRATLALAIGVLTGIDPGEVSSPYTKTNPNTRGMAVSADAFLTQNWVVAEGRPIAISDEESYRRVCVLGSALAKRLFPHDDALGSRVKYHGVYYQVIGVLESKGAAFGQSQDDFLAIPITTGLERFGRRRSVNIQVQAHNKESYEDTLEQTRSILRVHRKVPPGEEDDFEIISNDSLVSQFRSITRGLRIGSAVIASIALVAAGIGIMNIMLVSVTERTREIGIRRAIGARKDAVLTQFLCEAVVLSQLGGIAGITFGLLAGNVVAIVTKSPPTVPWDWVTHGFLICSFVGIAFGTYPAWKAAQLDPIDSLRYE